MQLAQNNPTMEQAWGVIMQLNADEQERAEAVEKARRDMVARIRSAEMKGREEGKAEGLAEGKAEVHLAIVANMLSQGLTVDQVCKFTGLSSEEVQSLVAKAKQPQ